MFGVGVSMRETSRMAAPLGCEPATLPFTYLGVPVGANMNLKKNWQPIIDRFNGKLSSWKAKSLSFGGRLTLIKSVLGNLPTYFFSLFVAPMGVISTLERIRRKSLWGETENNKKINWVTWEKFIKHKEAGGLGLGSLKALNLSLIAKWWWRLRLNQGTLWSQVIQGIHKIKSKEESCLANRSSTGVWKNIASIDTELRKVDVPMEVIMKKKVNKGDKTLFWLDRWIGNETLKVAFPNLYALEKKKKM